MAIVKTKKADLNIHYKKYFQTSIIFVLILLIAAFKFSPKRSDPPPIIPEPKPWIDLVDITRTNQITKPPTPPKPPVPQIATNDVIDDNIFNATDIDVDAKLSAPPQLEKPSNRIVEVENEEFRVVEEMPAIIGGLVSILKNIHYTELARRLDIEGRVIIEILVDKNGNICEAEVVKSLFPELDLIALNAVKQAKFTPGMQRGKPVKVRMTIPIVFKLK
ncbi:MAG: energy transducer TonB [Ignavibacteria bacterium]|nr:energy transducer TonB [Ignavibacteria bacterium]